jgi:hypothetical protein
MASFHRIAIGLLFLWPGGGYCRSCEMPDPGPLHHRALPPPVVGLGVPTHAAMTAASAIVRIELSEKLRRDKARVGHRLCPTTGLLCVYRLAESVIPRELSDAGAPHEPPPGCDGGEAAADKEHRRGLRRRSNVRGQTRAHLGCLVGGVRAPHDEVHRVSNG